MGNDAAAQSFDLLGRDHLDVGRDGLRRHCFRMLGSSFTGRDRPAEPERGRARGVPLGSPPSYTAGLLIFLGRGCAHQLAERPDNRNLHGGRLWLPHQGGGTGAGGDPRRALLAYMRRRNGSCRSSCETESQGRLNPCGTSRAWWELVVRSVVVYVFLLALPAHHGQAAGGSIGTVRSRLLLVLSNAVQNSMNAGDNSLVGASSPPPPSWAESPCGPGDVSQQELEPSSKGAPKSSLMTGSCSRTSWRGEDDAP